MIFRQWEDVLAERKTQTRRIVKPNELASGSRSGGQRWIHAVWIDTKDVHDRRHEQHGFIRCSLVVLESLYRLKWAVGKGWFSDKTYAVQPGRGKKAVGRIRITEIRRERLQEITAEDVKAEGLVSVEALANLWDEAIKTSQRKMALEALGAGDYRTAFSIFWDVLIHGGRSGTRWVDDPETWVLSFELAQRA